MNLRSRSAKMRAARRIEAPEERPEPREEDYVRMTLSERRAATFIALWTLATMATVCAFLVHLALRGRTVGLGYELGQGVPSRRACVR